jgi:hypothetical protein
LILCIATQQGQHLLALVPQQMELVGNGFLCVDLVTVAIKLRRLFLKQVAMVWLGR